MLRRRFTTIYRKNLWRVGETRSGCGSTIEWTAGLREILPALLHDLKARSLLDAGCGDWNWMSKTDLSGIEVHACDLVAEMIASNQARYGGMAHFFVADITEDTLPKCDAILCRTVLFHLSFANIALTLANFRATKAKYMLLTTHPHVTANKDAGDGDWRRLNMELAPFNLPEPLQMIQDGPNDDGYLGVWGPRRKVIHGGS